jgi:type I restriction enzyme M protein
MLDTDTKRRIDTARDILVGKVPDPKSQVEQITIALIYKFMDDMDAEAEELGGKRKFFTGEFARYGWAKLMRTGLGGYEVLSLYGEGISKMPENPGIPALFRDIFKNAYLPYRDPETLKAFLKIIDEFNYDHSECLGDAFEYLLSVLGSQGDAGQFRTPRHVIDFMIDIIDPKKNETILDPACGTAGFLISAYNHILRANTDAQGHSKLTPDDRGRLAKNFKGYDISPDMVRLSLVNMYLHGFTDPHIYEYDTLTSDQRWNEFADVILANPPFMSPKGGIKPHKRFSIQAKRSEVLFVDYMAEHLTPTGRAGIIVPEGIIERADIAYQKLRELLIRDYIIGVISLPAGLFLPYTKVKTSILVFDRVLARRGLPVLFSQVRDVGISLDSARAVVQQNDLPIIVRDYEAMRNRTQLSPLSWLVDREILLSHRNTLIGLHFKPKSVSSIFPTARLGDLCRISKGSSSSTKTEPGEYPLIVRGEENLTSKTYQFKGHAVCVPLLSLAHGRGQIKRVHYVTGEFAVANLLAVLQPIDDEKLNAKYLYLALDKVKDELGALMQGTVYVTLKITDLAKYEIPLPPIDIQRALADEYDALQSIIAKNNELISQMEARVRRKLAVMFGDGAESDLKLS